MKIINVVGARPNFMKIAPIVTELRSEALRSAVQSVLVHTGQHYDRAMSDAFFRDLELPQPDIHLGIGSGSHAEQTAKVMIEFERVCLREKPNVVLVVGDVNSTLAAALVAAKFCIPVAHVEAGLRSFDRTMPEEINRIVTDCLSTYLFTTCEGASNNLLREGIDRSKIHFVGNVMIDTLLRHRKKAERSDILQKLGVAVDSLLPGRKIEVVPYAVLTLHRPSNVDDKKSFQCILEALRELSLDLPIFFPVHPRTRKRINEFEFDGYFKPFGPGRKGMFLIDPLGYLDFLQLMAHARLVLTDSGGVQEETTVLGIPCLTLRENTERPVTITHGTNVLVGNATEKIIRAGRRALSAYHLPSPQPDLWDGAAAQRIVSVLLGSNMVSLPRSVMSG